MTEENDKAKEKSKSIIWEELYAGHLLEESIDPIDINKLVEILWKLGYRP